MSSPLGIIIIPDGTNADILTRNIGGLPLLLRQVRLLESAGCDQVAVLGNAQQRAAMVAVTDGRLSVPETKFFLLNSHGASENIENWYAPDSRMIAVVGTWIVNKRALADLVVFTAGGHSAALAHPDSRIGAIAAALSSITSLPNSFDGTNLSVVLDHPSEPDRAGDDIVGIVENRGAIQTIEKKLWAQCRKAEDGLVSSYFNRPISIAISKMLVRTRISPNQVTLLNLAIGLLASLTVAFGDYWSVLLGALLLKANSILDGVDGELARIRLQSSLLGEWLDTLSDDLKNLTFAAGIGYGAWRIRGDDLWLWITVGAMIAFTLYSLIYYTKLIRMNRGDILATSWFAKDTSHPQHPSLGQHFIAIGTLLFRQDLLVTVVLAAAVVGLGHFTIFMFLAASLIVLFAQVGSSIWQIPATT